MKRTGIATVLLGWALAGTAAQVDYRLLATSQTSTMERELNEAARDGYFLVDAKGGETEYGGRELVAVMERRPGEEPMPSYEYLVLATNSTATMQSELDDAVRRGFLVVTQTVYDSAFGGPEIVVILERNVDALDPVCEYELLAAKRTSTMEKELSESGARGFVVRGLSVSETAYGGKEVVVVMERCVAP